MKRRTDLFTALIISLLLVPSVMRAQAGSAGFSILKLGVSGAGVSMGDAQSANVRGAAATYYNPAGLSPAGALSSTEILLTHKEWIQDVRSQFLGVSSKLGDHSAIGFSLNTATVSGIEVRTRPGTPEGMFTARDFSVGLSFAHELSEELRVGITGKYLFGKIYIDETSGLALDIGAQYATPIERLNVGISLANLGSVKAMRTQKITLPALLRLGPAYSLSFETIDADLLLATDLLYIFPEKKAYINAGVELMLNRMFAARAGYQAGSEARGLSAGIGVRHGMFGLDYGIVPLSSGLGTGHTFTLLLQL